MDFRIIHHDERSVGESRIVISRYLPKFIFDSLYAKEVYYRELRDTLKPENQWTDTNYNTISVIGDKPGVKINISRWAIKDDGHIIVVKDIIHASYPVYSISYIGTGDDLHRALRENINPMKLFNGEYYAPRPIDADAEQVRDMINRRTHLMALKHNGERCIIHCKGDKMRLLDTSLKEIIPGGILTGKNWENIIIDTEMTANEMVILDWCPEDPRVRLDHDINARIRALMAMKMDVLKGIANILAYEDGTRLRKIVANEYVPVTPHKLREYDRVLQSDIGRYDGIVFIPPLVYWYDRQSAPPVNARTYFKLKPKSTLTIDLDLFEAPPKLKSGRKISVLFGPDGKVFKKPFSNTGLIRCVYETHIESVDANYVNVRIIRARTDKIYSNSPTTIDGVVKSYVNDVYGTVMAGL